MCRTTIVAAFLALLAATNLADVAQAADEIGSKLPVAVEPLIRWLPSDTETVIVTQGVRVFRPTVDERPREPSFWESMQRLSHSEIWSFRDGLMRNELSGSRIVVAVEGSRHFRSPRDLGLLPYEGCQIVRFDETADDAVFNAFQACLKAAKRHEEIDGQQVAVFEERYEQDDWTILVARPQPDVLLCATNRKYLAEVLRRMNGEAKDRALPESLPEWEHVNTAAAVWGLRHYKKVDADKDPSSPLASYCAYGEHDGEAVGFVFWYDPEKDKRAELRYLSNATNAVKMMKDRWFSPHYQMRPEIDQARPGVVRISYATGKQDRRDVFLLLIMGYLGHGVFI